MKWIKLLLGTAYAMWTGFGIIGTSILGVVLFQEKLSLPQVICIFMIVIETIGSVTRHIISKARCRIGYFTRTASVLNIS